MLNLVFLLFGHLFDELSVLVVQVVLAITSIEEGGITGSSHSFQLLLSPSLVALPLFQGFLMCHAAI